MNELQYKKQIYDRASKVKTKKELIALIDEITEYNHDYSTIVYGCMAAMIGALNVVDSSPQGGITGFQAGAIGWECINKFLEVKPPSRLIDYRNMLYPQYADVFEKTINASTWEVLQKEAHELLKESSVATVDRVIAHWISIRGGKVPFGYTVKD